MDLVLRIKGFDFLFPFLHVKTLVVIDGNLLRFYIDIDAFDSWEFAADIFDERSAGSAVDAGDGDGGLHMKAGKEL